MRWDEETGRASVFRKPSNFANGHTRDRQGRLVSCEHDTRRVTRTEYDGTITVLIDKFDGKPLNSPNDVVVKSDDSIWFTDPPFGILGNYEGHVGDARIADQRLSRRQERARHGRHRRDQPAERTRLLARRVEALCGRGGAEPARHPGFRRRRRRHQARQQAAFINAEPGGTPDGFRVDVDGNLWCGWGMGNAQQDGVKIFDPAGKPIGFIALPERCANVCFGGVKRNRLFMAASHSVYSLFVDTQGVKGG